MAQIQRQSAPFASNRTHRMARDLSAAQRALIQVIYSHQFGRLENMQVLGGQPVLDGGARLIEIARFDRESSLPDLPHGENFELKQPFCRMLDELDRLKDCLVIRLEFRHGLPLQLETTPLGSESVGAESSCGRNARGTRR